MRIGILALQGAFVEHAAMLDRLGAEHFEIRQRRDLDGGMDGLILPGGESTTMRKLLRELDLFEPLRAQIAGGLPVFGTCAGLILLADTVEGGEPCFGTMDVTAKRNAYGRQLGSFYTEAEFADQGRVPMTFIRAPYLAAVGERATALATVDGRIVAAQQGKQLACAFHPELSDDLTVHRYFLNMI
jgi:5'-phosphate synthase pdxT subunit